MNPKEQGNMAKQPRSRKRAVVTLVVILVISVPLFNIFTYSAGELQFSPNQKVNSGPDANRVSPSLTVDSEGKVYCVWGDRRNDNWDVYFTKSTDFGNSWDSPDIKVNSGLENQTNPSIAVDSQGSLYTVWEDDRNGDLDIYFASSADSGLTWLTSDIRISTDVDIGTPNQTQSAPQIVVDSTGVIHVVWHDRRAGDFDIFYAQSPDKGLTWTNPNIRVNRDAQPSPDQMNPTIAVDLSGAIYVAWQEDVGTNDDIFLTRSTDSGQSWTYPHIKVSSDVLSEDQTNPTLDVDSKGNLFMAWQDKRNGNDFDIYFAGSIDSGETWSHPNIRVDSSTSGRQSRPALSVSSTGTVYVAWDDSRNTDNDIYFAYSLNMGSNWSKPDTNVIDDSSSWTQWYPAISVGSSGPVHVAWRDNRFTSNRGNDIIASYVDPVHPFSSVDQIKVDGFLEGSAGINHIISHKPQFSFTYFDPNSSPMSQYNISVLNADASLLLWSCNFTMSVPSDSEIVTIYNTAPCPVNGPELVDGTSYTLRIKVANGTGFWSVERNAKFHLNEVLSPIPQTPSDDAQLESSSDQTITWSSPGVDSEGDIPASYNWEIATDSQFTEIIESGSGLVLESNVFDTTPSGTFYWRVSLSDGWETGSYGNQPYGFWDFSTFTSSGSNSPPTITNKADVPITAKVNDTISFTFLAEDPDSDPLFWGKNAGSAWLGLHSDNGTIYGTPGIEDVGDNSFTIQVADGKGGFDSHTFVISVTGDGNGDGNGNGDPQIDDDEDTEPFPCWIFVSLLGLIILVLLFFLIGKRKSDEEDEEPGEMQKENNNQNKIVDEEEGPNEPEPREEEPKEIEQGNEKAQEQQNEDDYL
jgi:hypothetical protein